MSTENTEMIMRTLLRIDAGKRVSRRDLMTLIKFMESDNTAVRVSKGAVKVEIERQPDGALINVRKIDGYGYVRVQIDNDTITIYGSFIPDMTDTIKDSARFIEALGLQTGSVYTCKEYWIEGFATSMIKCVSDTEERKFIVSPNIAYSVVNDKVYEIREPGALNALMNIFCHDMFKD